MIWISLVSSFADTITLLPATIVTPAVGSVHPGVAPDAVHVPRQACVCVLRMVTVKVPATPTCPALAPATTETMLSLPVAITETSFAAFT